MNSTYLGRLDSTDPLHEILAFRAYPGIKDPVFHVHRISSNHLVYRYSEEKSRVTVVGKFFHLDEDNEEKLSRIKGEYPNLVMLRDMGFDSNPFSVVKPLLREERVGLAVAEEFVRGRDLDHFLKKAVSKGDHHDLNKALSHLASFLQALHSKTEGKETADRGYIESYFQKIVQKLHKQRLINSEDLRDYLKLRDKWLQMPCIVKEEVIVHGDATPTNFIFSDSGNVVAIDLERMKRLDRVFDIGMICGELKHSFLLRTGNPYASEPFIRHFVKRYVRDFQYPDRAFRDITRRLPFYMALTELRIARNRWLELNYRKRLAWEAKECLRWGLRK
jgi:aminoglycoside phosphotransferase (APT) family kinase protein